MDHDQVPLQVYQVLSLLFWQKQRKPQFNKCHSNTQPQCINSNSKKCKDNIYSWGNRKHSTCFNQTMMLVGLDIYCLMTNN